MFLKDVDIKDDIYIIKSEISDKKSSANLYWKVIDTGSSFKIIDVIVENTSYFVTKKSEFNKILRKNKGSLEALIIEIQKYINFFFYLVGPAGLEPATTAL